MHPSTTGKFIDELVIAAQGEHASLREQYLFRQTLHNLVRQAKLEQLAEMRSNVERAVGFSHFCHSRRETKAILKRIELSCNTRQLQFEFDDDAAD